MNRARKIRDEYWSSTGGLLSEATKTNMSPLEHEYIAQYHLALREYKLAYTELTWSSGTQPPRDLFIQVRVLKDCGAVMTESGLIALSENSCHFLRRSDVEHLVDQGYLLHVK